MLKKVYPSKLHQFLFKVLQDIFPNKSDLHMNYTHDTLRFPGSDKLITYDIFIPSLSLAFECQGEQHYRASTIYTDIDGVSKRDGDKIKLSESAEITLIRIPYWWDHSKESLIATIHKYRPDVIKDAGKIPKKTS